MLNFELEIIAFGNEEEVDSLTLGHMTLVGSQGFTTSKEKQPDQSMMIFLSIVELLDGVRRFISNKNTSSYSFIGVDSSFQFLITKSQGDRVTIVSNQEIVDEVPTIEMIQAVWNSISTFISYYGHYINSDDLVSDDLNSSIDSFKRFFNIDD